MANLRCSSFFCPPCHSCGVYLGKLQCFAAAVKSGVQHQREAHAKEIEKATIEVAFLQEQLDSLNVTSEQAAEVSFHVHKIMNLCCLP